MDLTSDLIERYDCIDLLSDRCKAPDHSLLTLHMSYSCSNMITNNAQVNPEYNTESIHTKIVFDNIPDEFMNN